MSTIRPTSADDCRTFIRQYQEEIKARKYDIVLSSEWVPYLSAEEILLLAHSCPSSRGVIASHPRTPENILHLLIQDYECAFDAVQNPGLPASVADILSRYHDEKIRSALVRNQNTPVHIVERIARSAQEHEKVVKVAVANSRSATPELLALLANDRSWHVRSFVARHPDTPVAVLVTLAENIRDDTVRVASDQFRDNVAENLVKNPNTPTEALARLAGIERFKFFYWDYTGAHINRAVAAHPNTPIDMLWRMVDVVLSQGQGYREVFEALCHNSNTPPQAYRKMYKAGDASMRERLKKLGIAKWWWF